MSLFFSLSFLFLFHSVLSSFDCEKSSEPSDGKCGITLTCSYNPGQQATYHCRCKTVINDLPLPHDELTHRQFQDICLEYQEDLEELWINNVGLKTIDSAIFEHHPNLRYLNLAGNNLRLNFSEQAENLTRLDLSENSLKQLDTSSFVHLSSLKVLNVSFNRLEMFRMSFNALSEIEEIHLNNNRLVCVQEGEFQNLQKLKVLNLAHNFLATIKAELTLTGLEELYLNNNNLTEINQKADGLPNLKILKTGYNAFEVFGELLPPMLREFHGEHNKFKNVSLGFMPELRVLNMSHNRLETIAENSFTNLNTLKVADFSANQITQMHGENFRHFENLTDLNLSHNLLTSDMIDCKNFENLKNLNVLDLSNNKISQIFDCTFDKLEKLTKLSLLENKVQELKSDTFKSLRNLRELNLAGNDIEEIPQGLFDGLLQLERLNMAHNRIKSFDLILLKNNAKLTDVDMEDNEMTKLDLDLMIRQFPHLNVVRVDAKLMQCDDTRQIDYFRRKGVDVEFCENISENKFPIVIVTIVCVFVAIGIIVIIVWRHRRSKSGNTAVTLPLIQNS